MDVYAFQAKSRAATGTERALAEAHFLDISAVVGLPARAIEDGIASERAVAKAGGGTGFADAGSAAALPGSTKAAAPTSTAPTLNACGRCRVATELATTGMQVAGVRWTMPINEGNEC